MTLSQLPAMIGISVALYFIAGIILAFGLQAVVGRLNNDELSLVAALWAPALFLCILHIFLVVLESMFSWWRRWQ